MRLATGGQVDRSRVLRFRFDGREVAAHPGDTVASALLANGIRLMGRSFKYHRPRGVWSAGSEEPNALIEVVRGNQVTPNTRATVQEVFDGLDVRSQNRWPSLGFDVMGVNDLAAPFIGAGFYYKTFMWPKSFWERVYEPMIRRAAGLGALSGAADDAAHERAYAFCDVLVIGGGPAGLMAARTAALSGATMILADENPAFGGRLTAEALEVDGQPGADWAAAQVAELAAMPNVTLMPRTTVIGAYDGGTFGAVERVGLHIGDRPEGLPEECYWRIAAKRAVLCAGAIERGIAFPSNDRPGIMAAGAVRAYLHRYGVAPGRRVTVFGNNDDAYRTARDLHAAGVEVAALIDTRPNIETDAPFRVIPGGQVTGTTGRKGLGAITVRFGARVDHIATDCLAVSGGWNPNLALTCHMNGRPTWNDTIAAFVPAPDAVPGLDVAGAALGVFSTQGALKSGQYRAREALKALGIKAKSEPTPRAEDDDTPCTAFWQVEAKGRAWLDFQNDVTTKDVRQAARENYASVEHMKRFTTQGMATDQGKNSNVAAIAVLADATGRGIAQTGTTTFRPPYVPVAIGTFGAGAAGKGFRPQRHTTTDAWSRAQAAPMIEAGLWYRASYFPQAGETTWRQSCDREVGYVRHAVGVCDVSTLGKIDIAGPDAGKLLDRVYINRFSTLKVGRVRYGLMLREDGHVMDDGTCARIADDRFLMTTTTAAAGQVMLHLEFCLQVLWPDLDVQIASATDQWAQFAAAGPNAAALMDRLLDGGFDPAGLPFMAWMPVRVEGTQARLYRISFSGEVGYELAVPARIGEAVFARMATIAADLGGGPYGMEALNVLRIEKGFLTHAEIDGRVTARDVGLGGMMKKDKDFIGKTAAARPVLMQDDRPQLVGLKPVEPGGRLLAGAHLYDRGATQVRANGQGYITSKGYSPTLGHDLALGFLKRGRDRHGERVVLKDFLRGVETAVEVCSPVFFDPDGGRARG